MKIFVNEEERELKVASVSTLATVMEMVSDTLPNGYVITDIQLNGKFLDKNWNETASKTYLLDDDNLAFRVEEAAGIAIDILRETKEYLIELLVNFDSIAKAFRISEEEEANSKFVAGIDHLQDYLRALGDATALLGKPLETIIVNDVLFSQYINELAVILDNVIKTQNQKDWIMLADVIEYEMIPALKKMGLLYAILDIQ